MFDRVTLPPLGLGLILGAPLLAGCGSGGSPSATLGASNPGAFHILMADAPVPGVQAVNVTFTKVEGLYDGEADSKAAEGSPQADSGDDKGEQDDNDQWVTLSTQSHTVNLLDYANKPASALFNLVDVGVPSGHYKEFRFTLGTVDLVINGAHVTPILDSNTVVVKSECFVEPKEHESLVIDFDVAASLQTDGTSYHFTPKLRLLPAAHSGSVTGTVQFQATTPASEFQAQVELVDTAGQVVAESEVEIEASSPQSSAQGTFVINAVPPGTFSLQVVGDETFQGVASTPTVVQVGAGQSVQAGTVTLSH